MQSILLQWSDSTVPGVERMEMVRNWGLGQFYQNHCCVGIRHQQNWNVGMEGCRLCWALLPSSGKHIMFKLLCFMIAPRPSFQKHRLPPGNIPPNQWVIEPKIWYPMWFYCWPMEELQALSPQWLPMINHRMLWVGNHPVPTSLLWAGTASTTPGSFSAEMIPCQECLLRMRRAPILCILGVQTYFPWIIDTSSSHPAIPPCWHTPSFPFF